MRREEWLDAGLEPPFGTVDQWMTDQLGMLGGEEEAAYALDEAPPRPGAEQVVRILVAADVGLVDFRWHRTDGPAGRRVSGRLVPWRQVGARITGETRLSEALIHEPPRWSLSLDDPPLSITDPVDQDALLDFWRACAKAAGELGPVRR